VPLTVRTATVLGDRGVGRRDVVRPDAGHRAATACPASCPRHVAKRHYRPPHWDMLKGNEIRRQR
jgi:hypothetical protein